VLFVIKKPADREKVIAYLTRLPDRELGYKIDIQSIRHSRSIPQNKYYWKIIVNMLGDELGYSPEEMHDALRIKFLTIHSESLPTVQSTTKLTTKEFEEYTSKIREWASLELGVCIPLPNETILE
jgi:beta-glucosidase/6-phospho-beta-glucosidase/beta-galactosidase